MWSPLPGTFTPHPDSWNIRLLAAALWGPKLAFAADAAAHLTWWPERMIVQAWMIGGQRKSPVPWLRVTQGALPRGCVLNRDIFNVVAAEISAIQMAAENPSIIFDAIRKGLEPEALMQALEAMPRFKGRQELRKLLTKSGQRPYSPLELRAHEKLRASDIVGWRANCPIWIGTKRYEADIVIEGARLIIEFDGWRFHSSREAFVNDRIRQNELTAAGWTVLRFTEQTIDDLVPTIKRYLAKRAA